MGSVLVMIDTEVVISGVHHSKLDLHVLSFYSKLSTMSIYSVQLSDSPLKNDKSRYRYFLSEQSMTL